jgi:hypothetical protein
VTSRPAVFVDRAVSSIAPRSATAGQYSLETVRMSPRDTLSVGYEITGAPAIPAGAVAQ